jgi:hypothetical protein
MKKEREDARSAILEETAPFSIQELAEKLKLSQSLVYGVTHELISSGSVVIDHKIGKKMYYAVCSSAQRTESSHVETLSQFAPSERMEYIRDLTDMVIDGYTPSLLITGLSGIGKTYLVRKRLTEKDKIESVHYLYVQGHSSPLGLYTLLHDHRDATIVFDDCDSIFRDQISINVLKSALDSYAERHVSWHSSRMPEGLDPSFIFRGSIIFISNWDANRIDEAIKSRTIVLCVTMSRKEIAEYMRTLIPIVEPQVEESVKNEVMDFLDSKREEMRQFNIRTLLKAIRVRKMAARTNNEKWRQLVLAIS